MDWYLMASFAELDDNNTVLRVISVSNEVCGEPTLDFPDTEAAGRAFIANTLKIEGVWKQTSYNGNFRYNYAGIGFTYDEDRNAFIPQKPFESWVLNEDTCLWEAPVAYPEDGGNYTWDEATTSWIEVTE